MSYFGVSLKWKLSQPTVIHCYQSKLWEDDGTSKRFDAEEPEGPTNNMFKARNSNRK